MKIIACFFLLLPLTTTAQLLKGKVIDKTDLKSLPGANIKVIGKDIGTSTDSSGVFILKDLEPGVYPIEVTFVGYTTKMIPEVWIKNGKITRLDIDLTPDAVRLEGVEVKSGRPVYAAESRPITEEQINRFAATYYDPARLITSSPDVVIANDQNNQVSVRGISPVYNQWTLNDVEVVNPNHLSGAGTFSDQPVGTGGGVNMLSAQMLDRSSFHYGAFEASTGNAVSGVFDMDMRNGNMEDQQFTAQASLIGFDIAAEGPLGPRKKASILSNYRYSFTGLLGAMGVDFGGEKIGFQDLAVNAYIPTKNNGALNVFFIGGMNRNDFEGKSFEDSEEEKDRSDILAKGAMLATGISSKSHVWKGVIENSLVFSTLDNSREQDVFNNADEPWIERNNEYKQTIISSLSKGVWSLGQRFFEVGVGLNSYQYEFAESSGSFGSTATNTHELNQFLMQSYLSFLLISNNTFDITGSARYYYYANAEEYRLDYRLNSTFKLGSSSSILLNAGRFTQLLNPINFYYVQSESQGSPYHSNGGYGLMSSQRLTLAYIRQATSRTFRTEAFYYYFPNANIQSAGFGWSSFFPFPHMETEAKTYGLSLSQERYFQDGLYYLLGANFFRSLFDGDEESRYNNRYNFNLSWGKEFLNSSKNRSFSVNARGIWQGGMRYTPAFSGDFLSERHQDYIRLDLRLQWKKNKPNATQMFSLDIQNVLNRENIAYEYWDSFTGEIENQYQLGLIPILTYRLEF